MTARVILGANCTPPAIDEFPIDLFSEAQLKHGAIAIHIFVTVYIFTAIAIICDGYFVPVVEKICHIFKIPSDIGGATFMAFATASPELFVNIVGTFVTEGDIGLGTILGSAVFNILGVTAVSGLTLGLTGMKSNLNWWALSRDSLIYGISVCLLIGFLNNERIEWYEALTLILVYAVYIVFLIFDQHIYRFVKAKCSPKESNLSIKSPNSSESVETSKESSDIKIPSSLETIENGKQKIVDTSKETVISEESEDLSLWKWPGDHNRFTKTKWLLIWPINFLFANTVPNCEKIKSNKWIPLAFFMCIVWIGVLSYVLSWMITVIGDTFQIPDSVMGISFLAIGAGVPEAASSFVVVRKGKGAMGISNCLGSSTLDILLCLGVPWLLKSTIVSTNKWVNINSSGLQFTTITLIITLLAFYLALMVNKFKLDKWVGLYCLIVYLIFVVVASLIELNVFMEVNLPTCGR
ncbi:sodium/potassium/calcium exchanger 4-like isoform X1 [Diorhabda carinulata]|uniref:sodium/potassium/calcium exchanger 4-like isoform X1 n=2 Tax=Diorhabda carinulata TaxID=1163345 RepID=UPI0025A27289|nr:sodium/potassium/calcium exchanger 4-like isoform X1 [Diorhabda carinulata]